jgi:hypothetical protein
MMYQIALHTTYAHDDVCKSESHTWTATSPESLQSIFVALHARLASLPPSARVCAHLSVYNDAGERVSRVDLSAIALAHPR